jgi:hypothetical protein
MKTFDFAYVVVRTQLNLDSFWTVPCGIFRTLVKAEEMADAWHQQIKDKDPEYAAKFKFTVHSTMFTDE